MPKAPKGASPSPNYGTAVPATDNLINGIPRQMQFARWLLPRLARTHPWIRGAGFALDFYEAAGGRPLFPDFGDAFKPTVGFKPVAGRLQCGRPGTLVETNVGNQFNGDFICKRLPIGGQVIGTLPLPPAASNHREATHYDNIYYPGGGTAAYGTVVGWEFSPSPGPIVPGEGQLTVRHTVPDLPPNPRDRLDHRARQRHVPHQLVPYAPAAPDFRLGNTRHSRMPGFANTNPNVGNQVKPGRGNVGRGRVAGPPKPRTKEKKGRIPAWFGEIAKRAWDVTEANDLAENLFECLPDAIQKKAPKTGRTHKGSWAGEGHRYTSIVDKARTVHRNLELLDLDCAFRKVSCNHITDMLWGRFFGTVDAGFQRGGVSGYSFATRGSGADVTKESYDRFMKWIEANPALDRLLKSLDCESLGK